MKIKSLAEIMNLPWGYKIEKINCPEKYEFLAGWTGVPSISGKMIDEVRNSINRDFLEQAGAEHICSDMDELVAAILG